MWQFRSNQITREFNLLNKLFILEIEPLVDDVLIDLKCDFKTLTRIIHRMNEHLDLPEIYIDFSTHRICVTKKYAFYFSDTLKTFYDNTLEFQILEFCFLNHGLKKKDILDTFFISDSTLSRYTRSLNENLNNYGLNLSTDTFEIVGDELLVRNFFIQYYIEKNDCSQFKNYQLFQEVSFEIFKKLTLFEPFTRFKHVFTHYQWILFVSMIRHSQGYIFLNLNPSVLNSVLDPKIESIIDDKIAKELELVFTYNFNEKDFLNIAFIFFLGRKSELESINHKNDLTLINHYVESIVGKFKISGIMSNDLSIFIFRFINSYVGRAYFLFNRNRHHMNLVKYRHPQSIDFLYEATSSLFNALGINDDDRLEEFIVMTLNFFPRLYKNLDNVEIRLSINVFLVSSAFPVDDIESILVKRLGYLADFNFISSGVLLTQEMIGSKLWITDITNIYHDNLFVIAPNLIYNELHRIENFLLSKRKA